MPLQLLRPSLYPITSGTTTPQTTPKHPQFSQILQLVQAAVDAEIPLFQIREKYLSEDVLYELVKRALLITHGSKTRLLVNDRSDIFPGAGADGVQLTALSLPVDLVRERLGSQFVIGVSTHSLAEAQTAQVGGADFVVFGPVFETESKRGFGPPQGLNKLREVTRALGEFPVFAIGGITLDNISFCFDAGATGVAGISLFSDPQIYSTLRNVL